MNTLKRPGSSWLLAMLISLGLATSLQAQITANWIGPATGGEWNTGANWDTGFPPLDATTNAFIGKGSNVTYNLPMAATSFGTLFSSGILNVNTSGFNSGSVTFNAAGAGAQLWLNPNGVMNVTGDLGFCSNSIVTVAAGSALNITGGLIIGSNPAGGTASPTVGAFGTMTNNGGTINAASTGLSPGNAAIGTSARFIINGGVNNLGALQINRSPNPPAAGADGLIINNGLVNLTSILLGNNAWGTMTVNGGIVTNTGNFTIQLINTTGRPARFLQTGGLFVDTDPSMVILNPSGNAAAQTVYSITGGTNIVGGIQVGVGANIGLINFTNSAAIYIGSQGIISNGSVTANILLNNGGRFSASTDWTNTAMITLNGGSIDAQDATGAPHNIYSPGVFRGAGALNKTGTGTLTLAGSNTFSGATLIKNGTLALAPDVSGTIGALASPSIIVGSGTVFDVSQVTGYSVNAFQSLGGSGVVTGAVNVAVGGIINPGSNLISGVITFTNDLLEPAGAINHFDIPGDAINVGGSFTVGGTNTMEIVGSLPSGTAYALVHYGAFSGDLTNFVITGASGILSNSVTDKTLYLVISSSLRNNTNVTWVGNAVANDWDTHNLTNWVDGGTSPLDFFLSGDNARFDNLGASYTNVNIPGTVNPATIVVDSTSNYLFSGAGLISGPTTSLTKTNSGTLTVLTTNTYAGITTLAGGAVEVMSVANSSLPSPLGAATGDPAFLVFNGGSLRYSGDTASTDRGATFNTNGIIDVTNSLTTLSVNGTLTGPAGFTKIGEGTLILTAPNTYLGATTISNGTLQVTSTIQAIENTITFAGGTLSMSVSGQQIYPNPINVATTGALISAGGANNVVQGPWSGAGTLSLSIPSGIFSINANMTTNFTGSIVVSDTSAGTLRFNAGGNGSGGQQSTGSITASFDLGNGTASLLNRNGGALAFGIYDLGALSGGPNTIIRGSANGGGLINSTYYSIGAKNLSTTFAGLILDGTGGAGATTAIIKVGTGTLTLTGSSSYTGLTTVRNGVLSLGDGITDGNITGTTNINIDAGAFLDVSKRSDGMLSLGANQTLQGSGTLLGSLSASGIVSPGTGIGGTVGTLTVTNGVSLFNTTWMKLNRAAAPNSDRLVSTGINFGSSTLVVTNAGPNLHVGDTFTLFSGSLSGVFGSVILPNYYTWDTTQLTVNGTITVTGVALPSLTADFSARSSGTITFNGTNGIPGNPFSVLSSTNVALPIANWSAVATGNFDGSGNYSLPVTIDPSLPTQFFILNAQ